MAAVTRSTSEIHQVNEIASEVLALRQTGGFLPLNGLGIIEVAGADAGKYLQGRVSNDVLALKPGQGQLDTLLDRKAHVLAIFSLHCIVEQRYLIVTERNQVSAILEQLEKYHFSEKVTYSQLDLPVFCLQGPKAEYLLSSHLSIFGPVLTHDFAVADTSHGIVINRTMTGERGFLICGKTDDDFEKLARELKMVRLDDAALDVARVEGGILKYGVDVTDELLLPETGLEHTAASYNKGCFLGQEVLARIRSFGAPRRGLVGIKFDTTVDKPFPLNTSFSADGKDIGTIVSNVASPTLKCHIAFAYVLREFRVPGQKLSISIGGTEYGVTVVSLPFISSGLGKETARKLYDEALQEFSHGTEDRAIALLRESIQLDPEFTDAYESLGVMLSRQDKLDEAISLMHKLGQLDPESIMAHTNLSVFYMQQGDKEKAEDEKAMAMNIRMAQLSREMTDQKKQEEEKRRRIEEAEQRMDMFRQVLEIDADDLLANYGLGSVYVDLKDYAAAVPYLEKALVIKPAHTVAYLALGEAFVELGKIPDAIATYEKGIAIAAQRGDITPMKEMQAQLEKLK